MKDTLWRWFSLPLRHVCFVWHLLRSTDYMKVSRRENETGWSFAKWRSCPTVQPFHCQLDSNVGFLKMGGPPSHHGFQYVSIQKLSDLGWFGGPMRKTPNPSCLLLPRQAMQPVRSVSFIRKKLWPAVTPWRFGVFFLFGQRFTTVTATHLLLDMPWGAAAGCSAEWICWSVFHRNMIDN